MTLKKNIYPNVQKNVRLIFLHFSDQVHVLFKYITFTKLQNSVLGALTCVVINNRRLVPAKSVYVLVRMRYFLAVKYKHKLRGKSFSA